MVTKPIEFVLEPIRVRHECECPGLGLTVVTAVPAITAAFEMVLAIEGCLQCPEFVLESPRTFE